MNRLRAALDIHAKRIVPPASNNLTEKLSFRDVEDKEIELPGLKEVCRFQVAPVKRYITKSPDAQRSC